MRVVIIGACVRDVFFRESDRNTLFDNNITSTLQLSLWSPRELLIHRSLHSELVMTCQVITFFSVQPQQNGFYKKERTCYPLLFTFPLFSYFPFLSSHFFCSISQREKSLVTHSLAMVPEKRGITLICDANYVGNGALLSLLCMCVCVWTCATVTESFISGNRPGREKVCEQKEGV